MKQMKVYSQCQQYTIATIIRTVIVQKLMGVLEVDAPHDIPTDSRTRSVLLFKEFLLSAWMRDDVDAANRAMKLMRELSEDELTPGVSDADFVESTIAIVCFGAARKTGQKKKYLPTAWKARRNKII